MCILTWGYIPMNIFKTLTLSSFVTAAAFFVGGISVASDASATTLATFDIAGDFEYVSPNASAGSTITIEGSFFGDASGVGDTSVVQPLIFSAKLEGSLTDPIPFGPVTLLEGSTDPIDASLDEVIEVAGLLGFLVLDELSALTGGISDDILAYVLGNSGDPFEYTPGYTLTSNVGSEILGATVLGKYSIEISSADGYLTLDEVVSDFLGLDLATALLLSGGVSGNFDASLAISTETAAVPLPASLPLLALGGFALFGASRRRKKS